MRISQWAEAERVLSQESSAEAGKWRNERAPHLTEIMDAVSEPSIHTVVGMLASQLGKTEVGNNIIGFYMAHDPAPCLMVQPTTEIAEAWSKDRLAPMLRDTPALRSKVKDPRSRDSGNTILHKQFPGGHLTAVGANAPSGLASRPIRVVLLDEVDRYPFSAGTEGDPVELAIQRTANYWNKKIVMMSTPTIKDISRIEQAYLESDQRKRWVACPFCDGYQILKWSGLQWVERKPSTVVYVCEHCGMSINEGKKGELLRRGEWRKGVYPPDHELAGQTIQTNGIAGFQLSAIYSTFVRWSDLVDQWLRAQGKPERLKAFINLKLGETYEEKLHGEGLEEENLLGRREPYKFWTIPEGTAVILASVDTQNDRFEVLYKAYGEDEESWVIGRKVVDGDPARDETREALLEALAAEFIHTASGFKMQAAAAVIDTGGQRTDQVYELVAERRAHCKIFAIKGSSIRETPFVLPPGKKPGKFKSKKGKKGSLYLIGVHKGKDIVDANLRLELPGPGYMHFSEDTEIDYFKQLTAEVRVETRERGYPVHVWKLKKDRRNEALDLEVYNLALLRILGLNLKQRAAKIKAGILRALAAKNETPTGGSSSSGPSSTPAPSTPTPTEKKRRAPRGGGGGWITNY